MSLQCYSAGLSAMKREGRSPTAETRPDGRAEVSVVLPMLNEEEVVLRTYRRLKAVVEQLDVSYELLFVDDGSSDSTADTILEISLKDESVTGVFLSGHFGKEAALRAGLKYAAGRAIVTMDGDLQDPPERIPEMIRAWRAGADVVRMRRQSSTPDRHLDFMLYGPRAATVLSLVVNRPRYMKDVIAWAGLRETVITYERRPRAAGRSKWSVAQLLGFSRDGTKTLSSVCARILMLMGFLGFFAGLAYACYILMALSIWNDPASSVPLASAAPLLFGGGVLYLLGWLGEQMEQIAPPMRHPNFSIRILARNGRMSAP